MGERLDQWIERHSRNAAQYARLGYHPRKKREILHRFLLLWLITGAIWAFGCLYCANKWWYLAVPACLAVSGMLVRSYIRHPDEKAAHLYRQALVMLYDGILTFCFSCQLLTASRGFRWYAFLCEALLWILCVFGLCFYTKRKIELGKLWAGSPEAVQLSAFIGAAVGALILPKLLQRFHCTNQTYFLILAIAIFVLSVLVTYAGLSSLFQAYVFQGNTGNNAESRPPVCGGGSRQ